VDWAAAFAAQPEDTDWLVHGYLERGTLNALFAKPGTGKSLLALETAVDLVRAGEAVVYLDQENRVADLVDRLQAFGCCPEELGRLVLYSFARLPPLDSPAGGADLLALATVHRPALVVIDTATRMLTGHENDADTFTALYRCTLAPLKAEGVTVLRLDHPGKDEGRGQRGSSAKDADVDTAWRLSTVTERLEYRLDRTKSRSGHGPDAWTLRRRSGPLRHEWAPAEERTAADAARITEILSALARAGVPLNAGRPAAREALKAVGVSAPNRLVEAAIRQRKTAHGQRAGSVGSRSSDYLPAAPTPKGGAAGQSPVTGGSRRVSCARCPALVSPDCLDAAGLCESCQLQPEMDLGMAQQAETRAAPDPEPQ
jgi:hypothetical protein